MNTYNITEFSKMTGVAVKTLQKWDRDGKLNPDRTPTNRRMYSDEHLAMATGRSIHQKKRKTLVYCRVSSQAQKPDLENQVRALEEFCVGSGYVVDEWVKEIGGGLSFKRKKFLAIINAILSGTVERLVVAHKDRLSRFGFDLVEHICKVSNCDLVVINIESLSPQEEMIQDMLAIVHCFSERLDGLRNYKKALSEALENDKGA